MWQRVGRSARRADVEAHGNELLAAAPKLLAALKTSLELTIWKTGNPRAPRGVPTGADPPAHPSDPPAGK